MRGLVRPLPASFPTWTPRTFFHYEVLHRSRREGSRARVGRIHTPHGVIDTPGFVVVGTNGAVKFVDSRAADDAGMQLMFSNTLHLMIHPGPEVIGAAGGLHAFMGREDKPLITDSGGFQIFSFANRGQLAMPGEAGEFEDAVDREAGPVSSRSEAAAAAATDPDVPSLKSSRPMAARRTNPGYASGAVRVTEEGAHFRSYRDGAPLFLSPESSVEAQKAIGADIIIPLDDLPAAGTTGAALEASVERTHRWEARSLRAHLQQPQEQAMYGVVHGGLDRALRTDSVGYLTSLPFDGFALGGSLGSSRADMLELVGDVVPQLPGDKPNHLLGIGDEESIAAAVPLGVDTFDSCFPTRLGRHGTLLTRQGRIKIGQGRHRSDYSPIDPACDGFVSQNHTRAYLHHLFKAHEPVVHGLCTLHNIKFMMDYMRGMRAKIWRDEL